MLIAYSHLNHNVNKPKREEHQQYKHLQRENQQGNILKIGCLIFIYLKWKYSYYSLFSRLGPRVQVEEQQCLVSLSLTFCVNSSDVTNKERNEIGKYFKKSRRPAFAIKLYRLSNLLNSLGLYPHLEFFISKVSSNFLRYMAFLLQIFSRNSVSFEDNSKNVFLGLSVQLLL